MAEIKCKHCGDKRPALGFAPLPNELGQRIATEICQSCWAGWLQKQTQIINHYGLDLTNPDAQNFLFDNIKGFLFGEALPIAEQKAESRHFERRHCEVVTKRFDSRHFVRFLCNFVDRSPGDRGMRSTRITRKGHEVTRNPSAR